MDFRTFVNGKPKILTRLMRSTGLAYSTVLRAAQSKPLSYKSARTLSDATGGLVSVDELCVPPRPDLAEGSGE